MPAQSTASPSSTCFSPPTRQRLVYFVLIFRITLALSLPFLILTICRQGFTLEEMDDVFDSGIAAWKTHEKSSRLEQLEKEIEEGVIKVVPGGAQPETEHEENVKTTAA